VSPDGQWFATCGGEWFDDGHLAVWDTSTGTHVHTIHGCRGPVSCVAWSRDGSLLATCHDGVARVWEVAAGSVKMVPSGCSGALVSIAWSLDRHKLYTNSLVCHLKVLDAATGAVVNLRKLEGHSKVVYTVAWSPIERFVATGSKDKSVRVWEAGTGAEVHVLQGHRESIWNVSWSPDGSMIVSHC
jgi:WD40 repeat protein